MKSSRNTIDFYTCEPKTYELLKKYKKYTQKSQKYYRNTKKYKKYKDLQLIHAAPADPEARRVR